MQYYIITYNKQPLGESGESCNSKYDLTNACDKCGTGAVLIGNLRIKGFTNLNKDFFETVSGDYIISQMLYNKIKKLHTDFILYQVIDFKNRLLDFYHFTSNKVLPRFHSNSSGFIIEDQCQVCKRNGYFNHAIIGNIDKNVPTIVSAVKLHYSLQEFKNLTTSLILKTWECTGLSNKTPNDKNIIRYARPWLVVNEEIKNIFETENIKNIEYEQVIIE